MNATKRASEVRGAGLRRGLGATQDGPVVEAAPAPTAPPRRPEKPVRFTLDLDQERHAFLKAFALECGAGVGGAQVMRALLDELQEGSNLPMRVKARIWAANK